MSKAAQKKLALSLLVPLIIGIVSYFSNFFLSTFPESQANIRVLNEKYHALGSDIAEIKEVQKEFSRDQKTLINFLLNEKNERKRKSRSDG